MMLTSGFEPRAASAICSGGLGLQQVRLAGLRQHGGADPVAQTDRGREVATVRDVDSTDMHRHLTTARQPLAFAQDRPRAAQCDRNHAGLAVDRDGKGAQPEGP